MRDNHITVALNGYPFPPAFFPQFNKVGKYAVQIFATCVLLSTNINRLRWSKVSVHPVITVWRSDTVACTLSTPNGRKL